MFIRLFILLASFLLTCGAVADGGSAESISKICSESTANSFNYIVSHPEYASDVPEYTDSMGTTLEDRARGIREQEDSALASLKRFDSKITNLYELLDQVSKSPRSYSKDHSAKFLEYFDKEVVPDSAADNRLKNEAAKSCGTRGSGCISAFNALTGLVNSSRTQEGGRVYFPSVWKELGTDERYQKPLASLALSLSNRVNQIKEGKFQNTQGAGDLFTDLEKEFQASGLSPSDSTEMIWKVLGLYSARGVSTPPFFSLGDKENTPVYVSVALIASMISYLDEYSLAKGKVYSLPAPLRTSCDYSRQYHFWRGAYLAHELENSGNSKTDTFKTVHFSEVLYEKFSGMTTKKSLDEVITSNELHGFYNVEMQKNIAFNDAGAFWALMPTNELDVDSSFFNLYSSAKQPASSGILSRLSLVFEQIKKQIGLPAEVVSNWDRIIAPDADLKPFLDRLR
jgi:hypothetical protein